MPTSAGITFLALETLMATRTSLSHGTGVTLIALRTFRTLRALSSGITSWALRALRAAVVYFWWLIMTAATSWSNAHLLFTSFS